METTILKCQKQFWDSTTNSKGKWTQDRQSTPIMELMSRRWMARASLNLDYTTMEIKNNNNNKFKIKESPRTNISGVSSTKARAKTKLSTWQQVRKVELILVTYIITNNNNNYSNKLR